jgi:hypothetical protein
MNSAITRIEHDAQATTRKTWARHVSIGLIAPFATALAAFSVGCGSATMTTTDHTAPAVVDKALWVANGTNVLEYIPSQLAAGSTQMVPHLAINSGVFGAPQGVVFDAYGDLWVIDGGTVSTGGAVKPALFEFTPAQLSSLGTQNAPSPNVTIRSGDFVFPQQAVFDATGNMWVSDNGANSVFELTPAQLKASNAATSPNIAINSDPAFTGPLGIVFDASGDLFVANNGTTTIFGFLAQHLPRNSGTVSLTPDVMLSDDGHGSIQAPWALIFDAKGDLWSSNANAPNTVVEFTPDSLMATGSPTPAVTISPATEGANSTLSSPNGIAFDNLGDLAAVSSATPFGIAFVGKTQLTAGGAVDPAQLIVGNETTLNAPAGCNFGPIVN